MFVVIFTSLRTQGDADAYGIMAQKMIDLAKNQTGFVKINSFRDADGRGVTLSYWQSMADIKAFKANLDHLEAQQLGKAKWYEHYTVEVCEIAYQYHFNA
jgi:heme-degrading monooxygenase HmoA